MRLSRREIDVILSEFTKRDAKAKVFLFGSRTDDAKRGGDIDLLIESETLTQDQCGQARWGIWEKLGEQKIDIVLAKKADPVFLSIIEDQKVQLK